MRAADRKPFVGKTRRVFRQSQTAREGGLFLRESPHQLPANEHPIPHKYPSTRARLVPLPLGKGGFGDGRCGLPRARCALAMTGFPWSVVHGRRATARVAPTEGYKECLAGGRTGASAPTDMWKRLRRAGLQEVRKNGPSGTPAPTDGLLMVPYAAGHMGPALHYIIL